MKREEEVRKKNKEISTLINNLFKQIKEKKEQEKNNLNIK